MTSILILAALCADPGAHSPIVKLTHVETKWEQKNGRFVQMTYTGISTGVVYYRYGPNNRQFLILSCAHGKKKDGSVTVRFFNRFDVEGAKVIAIDPERDLAVVYLETDRPPAARVMPIESRNAGVPKARTAVKVMGYGSHGHEGHNTARFAYTERSTTVVELQRIQNDANYLRLRTKAESKPGDSGGALVLDGKLVGISKAMSTGSRDVDSFFVTHDDIWDFLEEQKLLISAP